MEIKPTYVTWEQAKLLKEKGFDEECKFYYDLGFKELTFHVEDTWKNSEIQNGYPNGVFEKLGKYPMISAPEQWQVVEFLRINHGIWVIVLPELLNGEKIRYYPSIFEKGVGEDIEQYFDTPQEAYSAAFDYILKELI